MSNSFIGFIDFAVNLYVFVIIVRIVLSWIPHNPHHSLVRLVYQLTEQPMAWIRQWLPNFAGLDFSPIALIFIIKILESILVSILH